jgi:hypothetical protein
MDMRRVQSKSVILTRQSLATRHTVALEQRRGFGGRTRGRLPAATVPGRPKVSSLEQLRNIDIFCFDVGIRPIVRGRDGIRFTPLFWRHFAGVDDPCQNAKVVHPLAEILLLALAAASAGADFVEVTLGQEEPAVPAPAPTL